MKIVIVEGIDRVGKTTLINQLVADNKNVKVLKNSYLNHTAICKNIKGENIYHEVAQSYNNDFMNIERQNAILNVLETLNFADDSILIMDRFHLTEYVYGLIERNFLGIEAFNNIDKRLADLGAVVILVLPVDIERSNKEHGKDLTVYNDAFKQLVNTSNCTIMRTDYNNLDSVRKYFI